MHTKERWLTLVLQLENVIHRHLSALRAVYVKYSRLGCASNEFNVYSLTRTQVVDQVS